MHALAGRFALVVSLLAPASAAAFGWSGDVPGHGAIAVGWERRVVVRQDRTVFAWGDDAGACYPGCAPDTHFTPQPVAGPGGVGRLTGIRGVSAGTHVLALAEDGTVWAWDDNAMGQLGNGSASAGNQNVPAQVRDAAGTGTLSGIVAVAAGATHSLAVGADGRLWAWGESTNGELGNGLVSPDGSPTFSALPMAVLGPSGVGELQDVVAAAAGWGFSVAVKSDGTVWTWGTNANFVLGLGFGTLPASAKVGTPRQVVGGIGGGAFLTGITQVAASGSHVVARASDGTVWAWGNNFSNQCGENADFPSTNLPLPNHVVGPGRTGLLTGVVEVAAGSSTSLARRDDGSAWGWGSARLLNVGTETAPAPLPVLGLDGAPLAGVALLAANMSRDQVVSHQVALLADGSVFEWGNDAGNTTLPPNIACLLRWLPPFEPEITCPASPIDSDVEFRLTWSAREPGKYELERDGAGAGSFDVAEAMLVERLSPHDPPTPHIYRVRTLAIDGFGQRTCHGAWSSPCEVTFTPPCLVPPSDAPHVSCPARVEAGQPMALSWDEVSGATSYEVDVNGDGTPDTMSTTPSASPIASGGGRREVTVRAVNSCGEGPWSASCDVRIVPDLSQCMTSGDLRACAAAFVEDPPGTFTATSSYVRLGAGDEYGFAVDGAVALRPATSEAGVTGRIFLDTDAGEFDIAVHDRSAVQPGPGGVGQEAGQPCSGLACFLPIPTGAGAVINPFAIAQQLAEEAARNALRQVVDGIPCIESVLPPRFRKGCLPYGADIQISFSPGSALSLCADVTGQIGVPGVPENDDFFVTGTAQVCAFEPRLRGVMATSADLRVAGCRLSATDVRLSENVFTGDLLQRPTDAIQSGFTIENGEIRCEALGGLPARFSRLAIVPADPGDPSLNPADARFGASVRLPNLSLLDGGLVDLVDVNATVMRRDPIENGYLACGHGGLSLLAGAIADIPFGFTLADGQVQTLCADFKGFRRAIDPASGSGAWVGIGGCVHVPRPTLLNSEDCRRAEALVDASTCAECALGEPRYQLSVEAGVDAPLPWNGGRLLSIARGVGEVGRSGLRAGGRVTLLGHRIGAGESCFLPGRSFTCSSLALGPISGSVMYGDALLGGSGRVTGMLDVPSFEVFCPACIGIDLPPIALSGYLGTFTSELPLTSARGYHYGPVISAMLGPFSGRVGWDLRLGIPVFAGIRETPDVLAGIGQPAGDGEPPFLARQVDVRAGVPQVAFGARCAEAMPELELVAPGGTRLTATSAGVQVLEDAARGSLLLVVDAPEAGAWTIELLAPAGCLADLVGFEAVPRASIDVTAPALDADAHEVAWTAALPASAAATRLRIVAARDAERALAGAGTLVAELPLVAGEGGIAIPPGLLAPGTYWVAALLDDGEGGISGSLAPGTVVVADDGPPEPPSPASAMPLPTGCRVSWSSSPSDDVSGYEVVVRRASGSLVHAAGAALSYDVSGWEPGEALEVAVRAVDRAGHRSVEQSAGSVIADAGADGEGPLAPFDVVAQPQGEDGVLISWTSSADAVAHRVRYGSSELVGMGADQGASPVEVVASPVVLTGFVPGQVVKVAVSSVDALGNEGAMTPAVAVLVGPPADGDADGMSDAWERLFLGGPAASSGADDGDGDHLSDLEELALGLDPMAPDVFAWGDLAGLDGVVDIADVVRALRLAVGLDATDADVMRRADVHPVMLDGGNPPVGTPVAARPRQVSVADVVMILRAAVGLLTFAEPVAAGSG